MDEEQQRRNNLALRRQMQDVEKVADSHKAPPPYQPTIKISTRLSSSSTKKRYVESIPPFKTNLRPGHYPSTLIAPTKTQYENLINETKHLYLKELQTNRDPSVIASTIRTQTLHQPAPTSDNKIQELVLMPTGCP